MKILKDGRKIYPREFKIFICEEYLKKPKASEISREHDVCRRNIYKWLQDYRIDPTLSPPKRKTRKGTKNKTHKQYLNKMTLEEQVEYLKMENDILKSMAFLKNKNQK